MTLSPTQMVISSRAEVTIDNPDRYAQQLIAHLGRKHEFRTEEPTATTTMAGVTGQIVVGDRLLTPHRHRSQR